MNPYAGALLTSLIAIALLLRKVHKLKKANCGLHRDLERRKDEVIRYKNYLEDAEIRNGNLTDGFRRERIRNESLEQEVSRLKKQVSDQGVASPTHPQ